MSVETIYQQPKQLPTIKTITNNMTDLIQFKNYFFRNILFDDKFIYYNTIKTYYINDNIVPVLNEYYKFELTDKTINIIYENSNILQQKTNYPWFNDSRWTNQKVSKDGITVLPAKLDVLLCSFERSTFPNNIDYSSYKFHQKKQNKGLKYFLNLRHNQLNMKEELNKKLFHPNRLTYILKNFYDNNLDGLNEYFEIFE